MPTSKGRGEEGKEGGKGREEKERKKGKRRGGGKRAGEGGKEGKEGKRERGRGGEGCPGLSRDRVGNPISASYGKCCNCGSKVIDPPGGYSWI